MLKRSLALTLAVGCLPAALWCQVPLGPAFRVNAYTTSIQDRPAAAMQPDGGFVVVWNDALQDGSGYGVFARLHDAAGAPMGAQEFRVNAASSGPQYQPQVALLPSGAFVVVWSSRQDGTYGIFGRRLDPAGTTGPEFAVNTYLTGNQNAPAIAVSGTGSFVVVWHDAAGRDGAAQGLFGQRYDASGVRVGPEFQVNTYTTSSQYDPSVAMAAEGRFVVVWTNGSPTFDVRGQRFDAQGAPLGGEFTVSAAPSSFDHTQPSVAMRNDGSFVVVWSSYARDGSLLGVFGRRFDAFGTALSGDFPVNTTTTGAQALPRIAMDARGNFVVTWESSSPDTGVFARRFDAAGNAETPEFPLDGPAGSPRRSAVAANGAGDFVTVWSAVSDGSRDVFARSFRPDVIFKDGFDTTDLAAWSTSATDGGDLTASVFAALRGTTAGLRGVVDDTAGLFVQDDTPDGERAYIARFYLDPNGFDPGEAQQHFRTRVFIAFSEAPTRRVAAIVLRRQGDLYDIRARVRLDDNSQRDTPFIPIDDGPHAIELQLAAGTGAAGGHMMLFIDGALVAGGTDLDNQLAEVDFVRLGALSVKPGASGTMYWDEFESRRQSAIGP